MFRRALVGLVLLLFGFGLASAQAPEPAPSQTQDAAQNGPPGPPRIAFVVGNAGYAKKPLQNALNDAGLVAEALRTIGFDIIEGADVNQADFMRSFRDFLAKLEAAGPDAIGFVYFSGYGFEYDGENYLVAADARLERENDIPLDAIRLSDLLRPLAGAAGRAKVVAIDAARQLPFGIQESHLAHGLAAIEAPPGMLVGFSAAPGMIAEDGPGPYGAYATALAEMLRDPGADLDTAFTRIRERTHQLTKGQQTPWNVSALPAPVVLVPAEAAADLPTGSAPPPPPKRARRPMRDIGVDEGYALAIDLDTLPAYTEYVETYPSSPYAPRVWAIIRARREALAWMRAVEINTPQSYWTYLRRYPHGIYASDAERRLRRLAAELEPPPDFAPVEFYDVPPPLPGEPVEYVAFYPPAPPPPIILIGPQPVYFARLPPPPPPPRVGPRVLPVMAVALPVFHHIRPGVRHPLASPTPAVPLRSNLVAPATGTPPSQQHLLPPVNATAPGAIRPGEHRPPPQGTPNAALPGGKNAGRPSIQGGKLTTAPTTTHIGPSGTASPSTAKLPPGAQPNAKLPPGGSPPGAHKPPTAVSPAGVKPVTTTTAKQTPETLRRKPPPPLVVNRPPPPTVHRPPPPPAVANRPPPVVHTAKPPPPPVVHRMPPPVARVAPPPKPVVPARKNCKIENGKEVCK